MIYSLTGTIIDRDNEKVAIQTLGIGYEVFVSKPMEYELGAELTLYTYEVLSQDDHYLVGFLSKEEKRAFSSLISVKGIGPKTAHDLLLRYGSVKQVAIQTLDDLSAAIGPSKAAIVYNHLHSVNE